MVLCKSCKKKDKREYADDCFACDKGDQWEAKRHRSPNKPKTNADRIRSMTDENLAKYLAWLEDPQSCYVWELYGNTKNMSDWLEWLKKESDT